MPDPQTKRFLDLFTGDVRDNILTFRDHLWSRDAHYFIFMARKAACFFDCLRLLKIADTRGINVTDRVLDCRLDFLAGKQVTLVDDCVFTGTTLFRARQAVLAAGAASFETMTLAINKDTIRPALLPGGGEAGDLSLVSPVVQLTDAECVQQCHDIVRAVSIFPHAYDVDYPQTHSVRVRLDVLSTLLQAPDWRLLEVSSTAQRANGVAAYTLLPQRAALSRLACAFQTTVSNLPHAKVRIYTRRLDADAVSVRILPIAMFGRVADAATELWLDRILISGHASLRAALVSPQARYRFLQFECARSLLEFFLGAERDEDHVTRLLQPRPEAFRGLFGPIAAAAYTALREAGVNIGLPPFGDKAQEGPAAHGSVLPEMNPIEAIDATIRPFTNLYKGPEMQARRHVYEHGLHVKDPVLDRLEAGIPPRELEDAFRIEGIDTHGFVSGLLDRLIDSGIAVPTVAHENSHCDRLFRHGEDAVLGEAQERMILEGVETYIQARGTAVIGHFELQKLIVLFIQIALRERLLDSLNTDPFVPLSCRLVSVKGYLHGPVPTVVDRRDGRGDAGAPYLWDNDMRPQWLTRVWERKQYLLRSGDKGHSQFAVMRKPDLSLGDRHDIRARRIGRTLGQVTAGSYINSDLDLVMLSTGFESDHAVRALSGELAIVRSRLATLLSHVRTLASQHDYLAARHALKTEGDVFTAVNSGALKFSWWQSGAAFHLAQKVREELNRDREHGLADDWALLWPSAVPFAQHGEPVIDHIRSAGETLVELNAAMRIFDLWLARSAHDAGQLQAEGLANACEDTFAWCARTAQQEGRPRPSKPAAFRSAATISSAPPAPELWAWSLEVAAYVDRLRSSRLPRLLDDARAISAGVGKCESMASYPYALWFDTSDASGVAATAAHFAFQAAIRRHSRTLPLTLPDGLNPWRVGRWYLFGGNRKSTVAVHIAAELRQRCRRLAIPFRIVVIGQLSFDEAPRSFSHSTELSLGRFPERVAELREHLLAGEHDGSIHFANPSDSHYETEGDKYHRITGTDASVSRKAVLVADAETSTRRYVVTTVKPGQRTESATPLVNTKRDLAPPAAIRVLVFTATDLEDDVVGEALSERGCSTIPRTEGACSHRHVTGLPRCDLRLVRSGMGSGGPDGSFATAIDAIDALTPDYILSCGIAFGRADRGQAVADVLVSEWIRDYEKAKVTPDAYIPRGDRIPADPLLLQAMRSARQDWTGRCHFGVLLSGEKLVNRRDLTAGLWSIEPEAIGGEMEGRGVAAAAYRRTRRWVVVKGVCDWGFDKVDANQRAAAHSAFGLVLTVLGGEYLPAPASRR